MTETILVGAPALRDFTESVVRAMGADPEVAAEVGRHLAGANLAGHDSHGVLRLPGYVEQLDSGVLDPAARAELLRGGTVTGLFDAHRGFGHHSTMVATGWVLAQAREHGIAAAAVRHSLHIGRLGEYTERLAGEGLVGVVTVGAAGPEGGLVAPFGAAARFLSTNPWSVGVPAAGRPPMIFDAATSTVAEGKVRVARARGVQVPAGALVDAAGRPTRDPLDLYEGGSLTVLGGDVAGHKGYGLSLASALIGGLAMIDDLEPTSAGTGGSPETWGTRLAGVFVVGIAPAAFGDAGEYGRRVAGVLDAAVETRPAPGFDRVLVPGDPERQSRERRQREGVPVPRATWDELCVVASRFGVEMPTA